MESITKMNPEVKSKWLEALRSGEYKQGKRKLLRVEDGEKKFCCLGVLTDIYLKETGQEWERGTVEDFEYYTVESNGSLLNRKVIDWAEVRYTSPEVRYKKQDFPLCALNDAHNLSFKQIANLIEKSL